MEPLAYRLRPKALHEIIGQDHLTGEEGPLRACVEKKQLFSMIFFGPPGTGKTTLAIALAKEMNLPFRKFNAVEGNKKDLDAIFTEASLFPGLIVIIDEIHRLNKAKQDLLLPHVENGSIYIMGATTANPLHSINPAIRSRTHLFEVKVATKEDIVKVLLRALQSKEGLNDKFTVDEDALLYIAELANGDYRFALNLLEASSILTKDSHIHKNTIQQLSHVSNHSYDRDGDSFYDTLSGFQKSIRGSDVQAALFYLAILIEANDMESIERRLLTTAYEDIGLANPAVAARATQAIDAAKRIGFPEARIPLSVAVIDLCLSPKSKTGEEAIDQALHELHKTSFQIPHYLRLTPVDSDPEKMYSYTEPKFWPYIQYLPDAVAGKEFYQPLPSSPYERTLLQNYEKLKKNSRFNDLKKLKNKNKK